MIALVLLLLNPFFCEVGVVAGDEKTMAGSCREENDDHNCRWAALVEYDETSRGDNGDCPSCPDYPWRLEPSQKSGLSHQEDDDECLSCDGDCAETGHRTREVFGRSQIQDEIEQVAEYLSYTHRLAFPCQQMMHEMKLTTRP